MPANLSPEYKAAEAAFRKARDPMERLEHLREMLRVMPKHKGTDHLQADLKQRIKALSEELEGAAKGGAARTGPALVIRPEGAGQIALIGPPNAGKSQLHARLTGSHAQVAPYPYTTLYPAPGMASYEDIHFQLIDLPAISPEHPVPWLASALQTADGAFVIIDISDPGCTEHVDMVCSELGKMQVTFTAAWPADPRPTENEDSANPFAIRLPVLLLANKSDLVSDADAECRTFCDLTGLAYPAMPVSATTGQGLAQLGRWLFEKLGVVRVYTKAPGKPVEKRHPFTLRTGQTINEVARLVHKELADALKYARVWDRSGHGGQHVGREHVVHDGDVVELHS
ncbi:MAG: GTPase [Rhodospirillaceae bacterium]